MTNSPQKDPLSEIGVSISSRTSGFTILSYTLDYVSLLRHADLHVFLRLLPSSVARDAVVGWEIARRDPVLKQLVDFLEGTTAHLWEEEVDESESQGVGSSPDVCDLIGLAH